MLNRIVLMGRLAQTPEKHTTQSGLSVARFALAVERDFKSQDTGEKCVDFIEVVAWRQTADFVCRYFKKGSMAAVEGRLQLRDWTDRAGTARRTAEVAAERVYFCGGRNSDGQQAAAEAPVFTELDGDAGELPF